MVGSVRVVFMAVSESQLLEMFPPEYAIPMLLLALPAMLLIAKQMRDEAEKERSLESGYHPDHGYKFDVEDTE